MKKIQILNRNITIISEEDRKEFKKLRRIDDEFARSYQRSIDKNPSDINVNHAFNMINKDPKNFIKIFTKIDTAGMMFKKSDADEITKFIINNPQKRTEALKLINSKQINTSGHFFINLNVLTKTRSAFLNKKFGLNYYNGSSKFGISNAQISEPNVNIEFLKSVLQYNLSSASAWRENYEQLKKKTVLPNVLISSFNRYTKQFMDKKMLGKLMKDVENFASEIEKA